MARKRPSTVSSAPPDERGRRGNRSPPPGSLDSGTGHHHACAPKTRARAASSSPTLDDALLPHIVPVRKIISPQRQPPQHPPQTDQRSPSEKQRPSAVSRPAGTPRSGRKLGGAVQRDEVQQRSGDSGLAVKAVLASSAAADAAVSPRRPSKSPMRRDGVNSNGRRPKPYWRTPAQQSHSGAHHPVGTVAPPRKRQAATAGTGREEEVEEEELTAEETMLLCGVQPGSSKALWFSSMLTQLDVRAPGSASFFSAADDPYFVSKAARLPGGNGNAAARRTSQVRPFTSPAARSSAASFLSGPLQLPVELLREAESQQRPDRPASVPAMRPPLPPPPSSSASALIYPSPEGVPQRQHPTTESDSARSSSSSSSNSSSDDEVSEEEVEDDEEDDEEEEGEKLFSAPPAKFGNCTSKPISEAADLLAKLQAAVAQRKAELPPLESAAVHLRRLRPSRSQLNQGRVHVISLEQKKNVNCGDDKR